MTELNQASKGKLFVTLLSLLLFPVTVLAASRILYELLFPRLLWLGRPLPVLFLTATVVVVLGWWGWQRQAARQSWPGESLFSGRRLSLVASFLPLLLNLIYLFDPSIDLVRSRLLFAASLWLTAVLLAYRLAPPSSWRWLGLVFLVTALLPVYLLTMPHTVGRADTFEFQVVVPQLGIAHPTGYPLYLLLGKLFTLLPISSVAWRLNFASAVYGLAATSLIYLLGLRLLRQPVPALLGAVALGLTPTFWSQAIEAEVYTLHALVVALALWLMATILARSDDDEAEDNDGKSGPGPFPLHFYLLALVIGLGLTNHLTTVFLVPPALLTFLFAYRTRRLSSFLNLRSLLMLGLAFSLPLLLYAYLPLRWTAVNGEPMGVNRFLDWVVGSRFQGALQWNAWRSDPARYQIVARLFLEQWGWINLWLAGLGAIFLGVRRWRTALVLLLTWLGYTFYCLNYYVPDLSVFLLPAQLVIAVSWAAGLAAVLQLLSLLSSNSSLAKVPSAPPLPNFISILSIVPTLLLAAGHWPQLDRSQDDGLTQWGAGVLELPLAEGAAILADSEKIAPLYYLQQAEGMRPDLDIMVLPDEAAYRAELRARVAAGQTVYLARFLPGLAGVYHLRSAGPLTEVSPRPLRSLPATARTSQLDFGPLQLIGYELEKEAAVDPDAAALTLYWQAADPVSSPTTVYVRWAGDAFVGDPDVSTGQHPANNYYPTTAWERGEVVPDFHLLPHPILNERQVLDLQVALAPPFTPPDELRWQTVTSVEVAPTRTLAAARPLRAQIGPVLVTAVDFPRQIRPQKELPLRLAGFGALEGLQFSLLPLDTEVAREGWRPATNLPVAASSVARALATDLPADLGSGRYYLVASYPGANAVCGWLAPSSSGCVLGEVEVSGVPLPAGTVNFDDKIALLSMEVGDSRLQPGGRLHVDLTWQSLAPMAENYTVFVQVIDGRDQIVGQVDAWPLQGTYPTSQWQPGETIEDPYVVQLDGDLAPGAYRLHAGWYLLGTLRRLPVLNEDGVPIDDKVLLSGLTAP